MSPLSLWHRPYGDSDQDAPEQPERKGRERGQHRAEPELPAWLQRLADRLRRKDGVQ